MYFVWSPEQKKYKIFVLVGRFAKFYNLENLSLINLYEFYAYMLKYLHYTVLIYLKTSFNRCTTVKAAGQIVVFFKVKFKI